MSKGPGKQGERKASRVMEERKEPQGLAGDRQ